MRTVAQLDAILSPYLAVGTRSHGTTTIRMLNLVLPQLYGMGAWKALMVEIALDCSAGYAALPPDCESISKVLVNDSWLPINSMSYEYMEAGPGIVGAGSSWIYGIIDKGYVPLMSDPPSGGIDELIFTSTSAFASGDTATVTYTDSEDGYAQVVLPLNAISGTFATSATHSTGTETKLNAASNPVSAGFVVGMGVTITGAAVAAYNDSWRVTEISATGGSGNGYIVINKTWAATDSGAFTGNATLYPANTILSVESIVYASLPARVIVKDADAVVYAILPASDGVAQYRRYQVPQPPETTTEDWTLQALCKRAFLPLVNTTDFVYLDNIQVLKNAFLAVVAEDASDCDRAAKHWAIAKVLLNQELAEANGGVKHIPNLQLWGDGIPGLPCRY